MVMQIPVEIGSCCHVVSRQSLDGTLRGLPAFGAGHQLDNLADI